MDKYYFSIAQYGKFLFRTDKETDDKLISRTRFELCQRFPTADGFTITEKWVQGKQFSKQISNESGGLCTY